MWVCLWQSVGKEKDKISIPDVKQFAKEIHIDGNISTEVGKISIPDLSDVVNRTNELAKTDTKKYKKMQKELITLEILIKIKHN